MCGRFSLTADPDELRQAFPWLNVPAVEIAPRYNIAPSQPVAVVPNDGENRMDFFVWGLVPGWAKDPSIGERMINARAETLTEKPSFRNAFRWRRCLILADGFYEWQTIPGQKSKQPVRILLKSAKPFALAGLWERWQSPDGSNLLTCAIITTGPNELMASIHNRMPVILPESGYTTWLSPGQGNQAALQALLKPYPAEDMAAYPISTLVNSPANDTPEILRPLTAS